MAGCSCAQGWGLWFVLVWEIILVVGSSARDHCRKRCSLNGKYNMYPRSSGQIAAVQWRECDTLMPGQLGCRWGQEETAEWYGRRNVQQVEKWWHLSVARSEIIPQSIFAAMQSNRGQGLCHQGLWGSMRLCSSYFKHQSRLLPTRQYTV